jgi:malonyl-CoA O-methyltransferase
MLRHARPQGGALHFIAGDAEALPLQCASVDLLFSSLALQWCGDFPRVLSEARRVLRPGGVMAFSSLCVGTLQELRDSWQAVDGFVHVNRFRRFEDYQQLCAGSEMQVLALQRRAETLHFADVRSLTRSLKDLGAHNLNPGRPGGLTGPARIRALIEAYETFRQPAGLPATYQVVYGVLGKPR